MVGVVKTGSTNAAIASGAARITEQSKSGKGKEKTKKNIFPSAPEITVIQQDIVGESGVITDLDEESLEEEMLNNIFDSQHRAQFRGKDSFFADQMAGVNLKEEDRLLQQVNEEYWCVK